VKQTEGVKIYFVIYLEKIKKTKSYRNINKTIYWGRVGVGGV